MHHSYTTIVILLRIFHLISIEKKNNLLFKDLYFLIAQKFESDTAFTKRLWLEYFKKAFEHLKKGVNQNYFDDTKKELFDEARPDIFIEGLRIAKNC